MSRIHKVDPRRTASLLDVFSCVLQGMIPWGAQLLTAASLTTIYGVTMNPIDILPYMWYCWILAAVGILSISFPSPTASAARTPGTGSTMWRSPAWLPRRLLWSWSGRSPRRRPSDLRVSC